jgi:hypothetical protein
VTIVDAPRPVTGGVDTHLDMNVAAVLDPVGNGSSEILPSGTAGREDGTAKDTSFRSTGTQPASVPPLRPTSGWPVPELVTARIYARQPVNTDAKRLAFAATSNTAA